jgi:glycosyltransferase involved in cell wall biosynthesis
VTASKTPAVSVIMPVYNVEAFVADAVRSVLAQTFTDFELIIIDDGGSDRSLEICEGFDDLRIRIKGQRNRGLAGARNTGIHCARGRYIALLDSDDCWVPEKLARHVAHLEANPEVGASYSGAELIDARGRLVGIRQIPKQGPVTPRDVFCGRAIMNGSTPVFRREMLDAGALPADASGRTWYFDEKLRRSEDVECWTRLALTTTYRFEAIAGIFTHYRVNAGGLSADVIRQLNSWDQVRENIAAIAPDFIAAHGREARGRELRYLARRSVQMRDRGLGLTLACEAISHWPRLLWEEPVKTLTTLAACVAMRVLPQRGFATLLRLAGLRVARQSISDGAPA